MFLKEFQFKKATDKINWKKIMEPKKIFFNLLQTFQVDGFKWILNNFYKIYFYQNSFKIITVLFIEIDSFYSWRVWSWLFGLHVFFAFFSK